MSEQNDYEKKIWLNSYEKGVKKAVDFQDVLIPQYLEKSAKTFPENTALIFQGFTMHAQLKRSSMKLVNSSRILYRFKICIHSFRLLP